MDPLNNKATVTIAGFTTNFNLALKQFSTGSMGFSAFGVINTPRGVKYNVNINVVEVGSRYRPH